VQPLSPVGPLAPLAPRLPLGTASRPEPADGGAVEPSGERRHPHHGSRAHGNVHAGAHVRVVRVTTSTPEGPAVPAHPAMAPLRPMDPRPVLDPILPEED
jgi:hypothetical protein